MWHCSYRDELCVRVCMVVERDLTVIVMVCGREVDTDSESE